MSEPPTVELGQSAHRVDKTLALEAVVEHELAARNAAVNVVGGSSNDEAAVCRHEISPIR